MRSFDGQGALVGRRTAKATVCESRALRTLKGLISGERVSYTAPVPTGTASKPHPIGQGLVAR